MLRAQVIVEVQDQSGGKRLAYSALGGASLQATCLV